MAKLSASIPSAQSEATPENHCSSFDGWAGRKLTSCTRLAGLAVEVNWLSGLAVSGSPLRMIATMPPHSPGIPKRSPRVPNFRHKGTKEFLWIEGWSNPQAKPSAMTQGGAQLTDNSSVGLHHSPGNDRVAGLKQAQLCESDMSIMTNALERQPREGVNQNAFGICEDVRMLCKAGQLKEALHMLSQPGISANSNTYIYLLQECIKTKDLETGQQVQARIIETGFKPNIFLLNTLVNMHAKCGSVVDARQVFDRMPQRDLFTWTIMMTGYMQHQRGRNALDLYEQMIWEAVTPNRVTFICALKACASLRALEKGKMVHADIIKAGIAPDIILETTLADMYAKCGSLEDACDVFNNMAQQNVVSETALLNLYAKYGSMKDACQVFDNMAQRNVVSWSTMISGYCKHGCDREALEIYEEMIQEGVTPDKVTFTCVLKACAGLGALGKGEEIHADIIKAGIVPDIILETALADMYAKCGHVNDACQLFENLTQQNVVSETALVDMYAKGGSMKDAQRVFDKMAERNVVSWNVMIAGYCHLGCYRDALEIYEQMTAMPDNVTFICVLNVCANLADLEKGKGVHADIIKAGIVSCVTLENSLVNMYAKCGSIKDAHRVFDNMAHQDVVSWNAIITGYAQHGCGREALAMYERMRLEGVAPNKVTFTCILNACANLATLEKGIEVHAEISKTQIMPNIIVETALVDMYSKCGSLTGARHVFDSMTQRDIVSWSVMIAGYAQHGCGREALQLFEHMQQEGLKPDAITFICVLSACSHVGLVDEGRHYFDSMTQVHGLNPTVEHFRCMVDLLGRAGQLDEAENFIDNMPIELRALVWRGLLGACRNHGNVLLAEHVAKCLLKWDPKHSTHVLQLAGGIIRQS